MPPLDLVHGSNYDFIDFLTVVFDVFSFVVGPLYIFDSVELTDLSSGSHTAGFSPRAYPEDKILDSTIYCQP